MAKPIFIVKFPKHSLNDENTIVDRLKETFPSLYEEYHVLVLFGTDIDSIQFESFNPKDIPDIDIEKLKEMLENGKE